MYRQCLLALGDSRQVAWIRADLAKVGSYLKIGNKNGWQILAAWSIKDNADWLTNDGRDLRQEFGSLALNQATPQERI